MIRQETMDITVRVYTQAACFFKLIFTLTLQSLDVFPTSEFNMSLVRLGRTLYATFCFVVLQAKNAMLSNGTLFRDSLNRFKRF